MGAVIPIRQIALDSAGRCRVYPDAAADTSLYEFVNRAAACVRWDAEAGSFFMLPVDGFTPIREYRQIISAVHDELGDLLVVNPRTTFVNIPAELEGAIHAFVWPTRTR